MRDPLSIGGVGGEKGSTGPFWHNVSLSSATSLRMSDKSRRHVWMQRVLIIA